MIINNYQVIEKSSGKVLVDGISKRKGARLTKNSLKSVGVDAQILQTKVIKTIIR